MDAPGSAAVGASAVVAGAHAHHLAEGPGELAGVIIAQLAGDGKDALIAAPQQLRRAAHPPGPEEGSGGHAVHRPKAALQQGRRGPQPLGELGEGPALLRTLPQQGLHLSHQAGLGRRAAGTGLPLPDTEGQQQLQELHGEIAPADALRHGVELGEDVLHSGGGPGHEASVLPAVAVHQGLGADIHVLQKAGEALRRPGGIQGHGDAVVMAGGKTGLPIRPGKDRHIPRRQAVGPVIHAVLHPALPAVVDGEAARLPRRLPGGGVDIPIGEGHPREEEVPGQQHLPTSAGQPLPEDRPALPGGMDRAGAERLGSLVHSGLLP